jgi:hypothetical protein
MFNSCLQIYTSKKVINSYSEPSAKTQTQTVQCQDPMPTCLVSIDTNYSYFLVKFHISHYKMSDKLRFGKTQLS